MVWCCNYCDQEFITKKDTEIHEDKCSKNPKNKCNRFSQQIKCYKCGRSGHYANKCDN